MGKEKNLKERAVPETCPHCGHSLSRWEQVLLGIDRAMMCKHCWYRILLDAYPPTAKNDKAPSSKDSTE